MIDRLLILSYNAGLDCLTISEYDATPFDLDAGIIPTLGTYDLTSGYTYSASNQYSIVSAGNTVFLKEVTASFFNLYQIDMAGNSVFLSLSLDTSIYDGMLIGYDQHRATVYGTQASQVDVFVSNNGVTFVFKNTLQVGVHIPYAIAGNGDSIRPYQDYSYAQTNQYIPYRLTKYFTPYGDFNPMNSQQYVGDWYASISLNLWLASIPTEPSESPMHYITYFDRNGDELVAFWQLDESDPELTVFQIWRSEPWDRTDFEYSVVFPKLQQLSTLPVITYDPPYMANTGAAGQINVFGNSLVFWEDRPTTLEFLGIDPIIYSNVISVHAYTFDTSLFDNKWTNKKEVVETLEDVG